MVHVWASCNFGFCFVKTQVGILYFVHVVVTAVLSEALIGRTVVLRRLCRHAEHMRLRYPLLSNNCTSRKKVFRSAKRRLHAQNLKYKGIFCKLPYRFFKGRHPDVCQPCRERSFQGAGQEGRTSPVVVERTCSVPGHAFFASPILMLQQLQRTYRIFGNRTAQQFLSARKRMRC